MAKTTIVIIRGNVSMSPFGSSPGVYVGDKKIDTLIAQRYVGKQIKITIEEISSSSNRFASLTE